ncbi:hypothetical protein K2X33_15405, partial [bacterium]|nr:hypothetical protein [bacterium]
MSKEKELRIFDFGSYREFLRAASELGGRGFFQEMAKELNVHSSLVSQIVRGSKDPTPEQTCSIAEWLKLTSDETEYLLMLVMRERAGNPALRKFA